MNLGYVESCDIDGLIEMDIIQAVYDPSQGRELAAGAAARGSILRVHFKLDTGMSRLGFNPETETEDIAGISALPGIAAEGIFTHFATSDRPNDPFQTEQLERFHRVLDCLEKRGIIFRYKHVSNSGGVINIPSACFNMVRPGIMLYGVSPGGTTNADLRPVMSVKATLAQVHDFEAPVSVSYGRTYRSDKPMRTGTVTIGYADGLHRVLSGKFEMLIRGKRVRQIGSICMDMCVVDLTDLPEAERGDTVTVFGSDGGEVLTVTELAERAGTIPYEMLCSLSRRVERVYK